MKRSSEAGPRCQCGAIGEIVGPGQAHCRSDRHGRYSGPRDFGFTVEQRTFYLTDDELLRCEQTLREGDRA